MFELKQLQESLKATQYPPSNDLGWLQASYQQPQQFFTDLFLAVSKLSNRKTRLFESYNFYYDLIISCLGQKSIAFTWYDKHLVSHSVTYEQLHEQVCICETLWQKHSIEPQQKLAIALPLGVEFIVTVLVGLKLGLSVSVLPHAGSYYIEKALEKLTPDYIVSAELSIDMSHHHALAQPICDFKKTPPSELINSLSYEYQPQDLALYTFAATKGSFEPVPVSAELAYLGCMRDAFITFALGPDKTFAAPVSDFLIFQPLVLMTVFYAGSNYIYLSINYCQREPEEVEKTHFDRLIVSREFRDFIKNHSLKITCDLWFQLLWETQDLVFWNNFTQTTQFKDYQVSQLSYDISLGGTLLFSYQRQGVLYNHLLPAAGVRWALSVDEEAEQAALFDNGFLNAEVQGNPVQQQTKLYVNKTQWGELILMGDFLPKKQGYVYPKQEIIALLQQRYPFIQFSLAVLLTEKGYKFVLTGFYNTQIYTQAQLGDLQLAIKALISQATVSHFMPDKVMFYPLYLGEVAVLTEVALQTGLLDKKSKKASCLSLAKLQHQLVILESQK